MIKDLYITGLEGKEDRLRKCLELLGDDNWGIDAIVLFAYYEEDSIYYDLEADSYYWDPSEYLLKGLKHFTYEDFIKEYENKQNTITIEKWLIKSNDTYRVTEGDKAYFEMMVTLGDSELVKKLDSYEVKVNNG